MQGKQMRGIAVKMKSNIKTNRLGSEENSVRRLEMKRTEGDVMKMWKENRKDENKRKEVPAKIE